MRFAVHSRRVQPTAEDGVTLGELGRRVDRFEASVNAQLREVTRTITDRTVPVDLWREAEGDHERRLTELESYQKVTEARFRATVLAFLVAMVGGLSGILVSALTAH